MWMRDLQPTGRVEIWKQDTCGRDTPTRHRCTTLLTCGNACTNTTHKNTGHFIKDCRRQHLFTQTASESCYIQQQMKNPEHCQPCGKHLLNHKRSVILECNRQTDRQRRTERDIYHCTRMSFQCKTDTLSAKTPVSTCPFSQHHDYVHVHQDKYSNYV